MAQAVYPRKHRSFVWPVLIGAAVVMVATAAIFVVAQVTNNQRWNSQRTEATVTLELFCKGHLAGVGAMTCQNWANQTVNDAPSTTDAILLCGRVFENWASAFDRRDFVSCLARAGVYAPE